MRKSAAALDNLDVLVGRQVCELVDSPAGPFNFNLVYPGRLANAEDFSWIMRRQIAAAAGFQASVLDASRFPGDDRAHRARIAASSD